MLRVVELRIPRAECLREMFEMPAQHRRRRTRTRATRSKARSGRADRPLLVVDPRSLAPAFPHGRPRPMEKPHRAASGGRAGRMRRRGRSPPRLRAWPESYGRTVAWPHPWGAVGAIGLIDRWGGDEGEGQSVGPGCGSFRWPVANPFASAVASLRWTEYSLGAGRPQGSK